MAKWRIAVGAGLVLASGCESFPTLANLPGFSKEEPTAQVASHPFNNDVARTTQITKVSFAPANQDVALRVDRVGQELAVNSRSGLRPVFGTIGTPTPEIFHVGTQAVYVTEGLVKLCPTDRELTAVLASELGKMISEREAGAGRQCRDPEVAPPVDLPIGGHGYLGDADPSRMIEMAKFEQRHPRQRTLTRPDPNAVARSLLEQAGHQASDLQAVQPILQAAERNFALEQQFKGTPPQSGWRP
jgi:hypothetical protein